MYKEYVLITTIILKILLITIANARIIHAFTITFNPIESVSLELLPFSKEKRITDSLIFIVKIGNNKFIVIITIS